MPMFKQFRRSRVQTAMLYHHKCPQKLLTRPCVSIARLARVISARVVLRLVQVCVMRGFLDLFGSKVWGEKRQIGCLTRTTLIIERHNAYLLQHSEYRQRIDTDSGCFRITLYTFYKFKSKTKIGTKFYIESGY